jgi:hypothetical protein
LPLYSQVANVDYNPLEMWKTIQNEFLTMAIMAQDILAILVSKAGIEYLFNQGHNIYYYWQNKLNG